MAFNFPVSGSYNSIVISFTPFSGGPNLKVANAPFMNLVLSNIGLMALNNISALGPYKYNKPSL